MLLAISVIVKIRFGILKLGSAQKCHQVDDGAFCLCCAGFIAV